MIGVAAIECSEGPKMAVPKTKVANLCAQHAQIDDVGYQLRERIPSGATGIQLAFSGPL
jgi:hypothetical protein